MSFSINNPMSMLYSTHAMSTFYSNLGTSIEKLASGLKVSTSADDPSAYAQAQFMRAEVSALQQGARNANDAISLVQVADGSLQIIDEKLIRMKELAEQAATGTYDSIQRAIIDSEYQAMAAEVTRIANATEFNNIKLLNGNISADEYLGGFFNDPEGQLKIQYGDTNQPIKDYTFLQIGDSTAEAYGLGNGSAAGSMGFSISTQEGAANALLALDVAIGSKNMIRANLGGLQNRLESVVNQLTFKAESTTAGISSLTDVDVAEEMTNFTKQQILTNTAGSIITQANTTVKMALDILQK